MCQVLLWNSFFVFFFFLVRFLLLPFASKLSFFVKLPSFRSETSSNSLVLHLFSRCSRTGPFLHSCTLFFLYFAIFFVFVLSFFLLSDFASLSLHAIVHMSSPILSPDNMHGFSSVPWCCFAFEHFNPILSFSKGSSSLVFSLQPFLSLPIPFDVNEMFSCKHFFLLTFVFLEGDL